jgi:membrane protease YdiL (CAAX protease family)
VLVAVARGHRVGRVRLHERWGGAGWPVLGTALAVAVAAEVIFRGVGLHLLVTELGWPAAAAVGLTAVGYGLNHLYFGPLTVLQKSVTGVLLGVLFLASGHSLLVVVVAHGVQNVAILGLARRREVHR